MTRARSHLSVLVGAVLATGAVAACSKEKVETPAEQAAEPIGETETSAAERPVPSLPAPGGNDVEPAEPVAPEASAPGIEAGQDGRRGRGRERRARMLERFDQNKDGQIDDSERTAMRGERAARMIARLDSDGDGSLSRDELAAVEGQGRRRFFDIAGADANGDGAVSAAELEAHMAERMNRRRGGPDADGEAEGDAPDGDAPEGAARPE